MTTPEKLNQKGAKKLVPWQRSERRTNDILVAFVAALKSKKDEAHERVTREGLVSLARSALSGAHIIFMHAIRAGNCKRFRGVACLSGPESQLSLN